MKKTWFHTRKDFKGKVALEELRRAHIIIALLSISLAFIILVISIYPIQFELLPASIVTALLIITTAVSLSLAFSIKVKN